MTMFGKTPKDLSELDARIKKWADAHPLGAWLAAIAIAIVVFGLEESIRWLLKGLK